jgi:GT2 family glycosyltransferase
VALGVVDTSPTETSVTDVHATDDVELSVVVLAWDNLDLTRACVDSIRRGTSAGHELIIVDNGSARDAADYASQAADRAVLNESNLGFARGMNQGLACARGDWIAFCNNDTILPSGWAARLLDAARAHPRAGIVVPAVTTASNPTTVRTDPGTRVVVLDPFSAPPPAIVFLMRRQLVIELEAWDEAYEVASGEDVDLCFKVWTNDLDIVFDERVLVEHVGHATARRLGDWQQRWMLNRRYFLEKWQGDADPPRLSSCDADRFARNRATARAVAGWMEKYFHIRDARSTAGAGNAAPVGNWRRLRRAVARSLRDA